MSAWRGALWGAEGSRVQDGVEAMNEESGLQGDLKGAQQLGGLGST